MQTQSNKEKKWSDAPSVQSEGLVDTNTLSQTLCDIYQGIFLSLVQTWISLDPRLNIHDFYPMYFAAFLSFIALIDTYQQYGLCLFYSAFPQVNARAYERRMFSIEEFI